MDRKRRDENPSPSGIDADVATSGREFLSPLQAAHYLGITPELLFSYTRARFRPAPLHTRRLGTVEVGGSTRFDRFELDDFDSYLKRPWVDVGTDRPEVPKCVLAHLHAESANQCMRCGSGIGVQTAHIVAWSISRSHHHHNLLRICTSCHVEHDDHNSLPTEELTALKERGIARIRLTLEQRMWAREKKLALPKPDVVFFGREPLLQTLREALQTSRCILIRGPGGIGKTQLLLQALLGVETGRRIVWLDVERYSSAEALRSALELLVEEQAPETKGQDLVGRLDSMQASVVFDGVEQLRGPKLDELDDFLYDLHSKSSSAQYVLTTQVNLQRTLIDEEIELPGLDEVSSGKLLRRILRNIDHLDNKSEAQLLAFADGHPLTLRLSAALVNHYGTARATLRQIELRGAAILELQKRTRQDRRTSLSICLSLAYDSLTTDETRFLFLVANSPAGVFSAMLETGRHGISDGRSAIAGLQRWSLLQSTSSEETPERLHMLSPIAAYVDQRWRSDHPAEAQEVVNELLRDFTVMAAVICQRAEDPDLIPQMLARFTEELPNLLRVFDAAEAQPGNSDIALRARALCRMLMGVFFILRLADLGTRVMLRGTRLALRDGMASEASDLLVQMVALARRNDDADSIQAAHAMIADIERRHLDSKTRGNLELARAVLARHGENAPLAEQHALQAIEHFEAARLAHSQHDDRSQPETSDDRTESIQNDLSQSFSMLGDALLAQSRFEDSLAAYQKSLSLLRGDSIAVNDGQLLHQIGNCESHLEHFEVAAECYVKAAKRFYSIQMREYLANALGELGHTALDLMVRDYAMPPLPESNMLVEGVYDVFADVARCFADAPFDRGACSHVIRKLFGIIVLVSLTSEARDLRLLGSALKSQIIAPAQAMCERARNGPDAFLVHCLERLAALAEAIAKFEEAAASGTRDFEEVRQLGGVCASQGPIGGVGRRSIDWFDSYLLKKWSIGIPDEDER